MTKRILFIVVILTTSLFGEVIANENTENIFKKKKSRVYKKTERKLMYEIKKCMGTPYKYGGTTTKGFDCSGFVSHIYRNVYKISLPRSSKNIMKRGKMVSKKRLKTGDLLFFKPKRNYYHVGIYIGNGKFVHTSSTLGVSEASINSPYWKKCYLKAKRFKK